MDIKKLYTYTDGKQLWRLLINENDNLIIETRDVENREVFFNCIDINTGEAIFEQFQHEEKYWVGIEALTADKIIFHRFAKPDMPGHKDIIVFDIESQKVLWQTDEYSFLFVYKDKIYCFRQKFEGRDFYVLDINTGDLIEEPENDYMKINMLKNEAENAVDYSVYKFPEVYNADMIKNQSLKNIVHKYTLGSDIEGNIEYVAYGDLLMFNFHSRTEGNGIINKFICADIESGVEVFSEILNLKLNAFVPDSFFVYKNLLILLKEKDSVIVCKLS